MSSNRFWRHLKPCRRMNCFGQGFSGSHKVHVFELFTICEALRCTAMQEEAPSTTIPASRPKRCFSIVMTGENSLGRAATDSIKPDWVSSSIGLAPTILPFGPMEDGRTMDKSERPSLLQPTSHLWSCWSRKTVFSLTSCGLASDVFVQVCVRPPPLAAWATEPGRPNPSRAT
ncbi:hypothetical protein BDP81DRAFT_204463 [Colletotrichum phormii]|uniref:Uncharacterized protein n=1 Tax=Colletotrichum phormii TaxID=359342 RepID=A0AAI9ZU45_9PEZI|nr:uncharacterized protein BDP81DRAFT_204463 [Colletotrichum phormii]KAK1638247.1 hypothetical protein BDP81DRAFT_204463 [Colletotrichum phormii]